MKYPISSLIVVIVYLVEQTILKFKRMKKFMFILLFSFSTLAFAGGIEQPWHPCGVQCARTHGPMKPKPAPDVVDLFLIFIGL